MLKAGQKISVDSNSFQSYEGELLAPIIDINGLVLKAEYGISSEIKEFLNKKGANVECVNWSDSKGLTEEKLIKLTGEFSLNKAEVRRFLIENPEILKDQKIPLEKLPLTIKMREHLGKLCIKKRKNFYEADNLLHFKKNKVTASLFSSNGISIQNAKVSEFEHFADYDLIRFSSKNNNLSGKKIEIKGRKLNEFKEISYFDLKDSENRLNLKGFDDDPDVGIMSEIMSLEDTNLSCD